MNEPDDDLLDWPSAGLRGPGDRRISWDAHGRRRGVRRWQLFAAVFVMVISFLIANSYLGPAATTGVLMLELIVFLIVPQRVRNINRARSRP